MATPSSSRAGGGMASSSVGTYVRFSDQLTQSITDISRIIEQHKSMIDSIQEIALELTSSIAALHALTVKYAGIANQILDVLVPILKNVPLIPKNVTNMLGNLEGITQKIIDNEAATARTISDVQSGLRTGDVNKIKGHTSDLQAVTRTLTAMLPR